MSFWLLEIEVLEALYPDRQLSLDVWQLSKIDVDQFYGIEIEEFPVCIAEGRHVASRPSNEHARPSEAFGLCTVTVTKLFVHGAGAEVRQMIGGR